MKQYITIIAFLATFVVLSGCKEQTTETRHLLNHLTPNMHGLAETFDENDASIAVTNNSNSREYEDDWQRFWLLDKPSVLSPFPVVND